ncbi:unnamed protein product, partial [Polarella glacialis]
VQQSVAMAAGMAAQPSVPATALRAAGTVRPGPALREAPKAKRSPAPVPSPLTSLLAQKPHGFAPSTPRTVGRVSRIIDLAADPSMVEMSRHAFIPKTRNVVQNDTPKPDEWMQSEAVPEGGARTLHRVPSHITGHAAEGAETMLHASRTAGKGWPASSKGFGSTQGGAMGATMGGTLGGTLGATFRISKRDGAKWGSMKGADVSKAESGWRGSHKPAQSTLQTEEAKRTMQKRPNHKPGADMMEVLRSE